MNDPKYPIVNISYQNDILYENPDFINFTFRYREIRSVFSEDANIHIVYSLLNETRLKGKLNIGQTIFVCIALALFCMFFGTQSSSYIIAENLKIVNWFLHFSIEIWLQIFCRNRKHYFLFLENQLKWIRQNRFALCLCAVRRGLRCPNCL